MLCISVGDDLRTALWPYLLYFYIALRKYSFNSCLSFTQTSFKGFYRAFLICFFFFTNKYPNSKTWCVVENTFR